MIQKTLALALFSVALASTAQARDISNGCARTVEYHCSLGRPGAEVGMLKLEEGKMALQAQDYVNHYAVSANLKTPAAGAPGGAILILRAIDGSMQQLKGESIASFGTDFLSLNVPGHGPGALNTNITCVAEDRRPDPSGRSFVSQIAPPAPQPENVRPNPGYVWIAGQWELRLNRWHWQPGHWERQRAGRSYVPAAWLFCDGRFLWADALWVRH